MDCLKEWESFIHLAIPSMLMLCAEWWTYEIGGLLSGQGAYFMILKTCWMFVLYP